MYRIGFDVGGTFTDFTAMEMETGTTTHFKTASTPHDPSEAIETGLAHFVHQLGFAPGAFEFVGHGTTVATNMVIERRGVPTGLITTRGCRDVLEIGRQTRPHLYDYSVTKPEPLVERWMSLEVTERLDAGGRVLHPLNEEEVHAAAHKMKAAGIQAVAICFLHAYRDPVHERRAAEIVRAMMPEAYISLSSEVLPEYREFERFSTTVINAYVGPRMDRYLAKFVNRLETLGLHAAPRTIHSNGGLMSVETVRAFPVRTCLSGPAAGVVGAVQVAARSGFSEIITYDVGGTSTDVSLALGGRPAFTTNRLVAGYPVRTPMLDIHVIGAGGGSIAAIDDAGALKVGPRSAGAHPGPVAYGRGGVEPTVTDANLVLGRLSSDTLLSGRMTVDAEAARRAIAERIAKPLGLTTEEAALGILRIAVANMGRAIRAVSTEKGHRLSEFALFAYGGAGPLHAAAVARETGMKTVIVPLQPGTMCARGILLSDVGFDFVRTGVVEASQESWASVRSAFDAMTIEGSAWLEGEGIAPDRRSMSYVADARYDGQNHEVQVDLPHGTATGFAAFLEGFRSAHRQEYGYDIEGRAVEIVNLRLSVKGTAASRPESLHQPEAGDPTVGRRSVYFEGGWREAAIYDRARLPVDQAIPGPAIIQEMSSTTIVEPGQTVRVDDTGTMIIEVSAQ
ncbi:hydantoinase/oxoprolinase family protein [Chelativorans sp. AA-79]|uniref:hydantoinase/oxoprolinase family protein n=1 Tax=Chelativorans sp. AA-79 TaxID=3028735 RepID=UPI0023FA0C60|nr:hydantoinase/oxoprolinase family protein [Chelativorans sp. AA-79]WEX08275.1 hydantoinase/oxoprolinase family protein [Chelativorans sp. AA-79]